MQNPSITCCLLFECPAHSHSPLLHLHGFVILRCHLDDIILDASLWDGLLFPPGIVPGSQVHSFSLPISALLYRVVQGLLQWGTFGLFPVHYDESVCCEHECTGFCVNIGIHFSGLNAQEHDCWSWVSEGSVLSIFLKYKWETSDCGMWIWKRPQDRGSGNAIGQVTYLMCSNKLQTSHLTWRAERIKEARVTALRNACSWPRV